MESEVFLEWTDYRQVGVTSGYVRKAHTVAARVWVVLRPYYDVLLNGDVMFYVVTSCFVSLTSGVLARIIIVHSILI